MDKRIVKLSKLLIEKRYRILLGIIATNLAMTVGRAFADPSGASILANDPLSKVSLATNMAWVLASSALIWFMQLGFAFLGAGLLRTKSQVNYWSKSYIDFSIGVVIFALVGFGLMFGGSGATFPAGIDSSGNIVYVPIPGIGSGNSLIGFSGFGLAGDAYDPLTLVYFFFQAVFAATSVTIVAGMVAERMKFQAYLLYTVLINILIYPVYGHWIWGGGWLATLPFGVGARDFAGSGAVHAVGGFTGLAGALLLGARIGKFNKDGTPNPMPAHNIPYCIAGTFILFFGWFGFNPGSTLGTIDYRTATVAVNTFLAGGAGAAILAYWTYFEQKNWKGKVSDPIAISTGALGGLVAVTAPAAYIAPWAAIIIGIAGGLIAVYGNFFVERKLKIDDPVGAFGVHGAAGLFGLLAVGLFADGTYGGVKGVFLFGEAGVGQLIAQLIDMGVVAGFSFGMGFIIFSVIKRITGLRVSPEVELDGVDKHEHGYVAYPETSLIRAEVKEVLELEKEALASEKTAVRVVRPSGPKEPIER
ncbi:MAG: ammonium transporter [Thaumarchaeota archaeon]|nr:ammonium transporter [Nitrososphaerota archaeon]MCL5319034.1 ammonium transporter [Nitrososphaerota archaeon]